MTVLVEGATMVMVEDTMRGSRNASLMRSLTSGSDARHGAGPST